MRSRAILTRPTLEATVSNELDALAGDGVAREHVHDVRHAVCGNKTLRYVGPRAPVVGMLLLPRDFRDQTGGYIVQNDLRRCTVCKGPMRLTMKNGVIVGEPT